MLTSGKGSALMMYTILWDQKAWGRETDGYEIILGNTQYRFPNLIRAGQFLSVIARLLLDSNLQFSYGY